MSRRPYLVAIATLVIGVVFFIPLPQQPLEQSVKTPQPTEWTGPIWANPVQRPFPNDMLYKGYSKSGLEIEFDWAPNSNKKYHKIAVVFFGLVKNVSAEQVRGFQRSIVQPLSSLGKIDAFLHTFRERNFSNPRNKEDTHFDQDESIAKIRNLFPGKFRTVIEESETAHHFFGPTLQYLRNGGAWAAHSELSTHYYLRQQYSLLRATEMWTGVNYSGLLNSTDPLPLPTRDYSCVVYVRPDLLLEVPLPAHALRAMCRKENTGHRDVVVPVLEYGGWHDRSAFGTPEGMTLYGIRGLRIQRFVDAGNVPHAESYLARFLCENNVTVHLAPWTSRRVRADGRLEDAIAKAQLDKFYEVQTRIWYDFTRLGWKKRGSMNCVSKSIWS